MSASSPADLATFQDQIRQGIPREIPPMPAADPAVSRAPERPMLLSAAEKRLALRNALRYFPPAQHAALAPEFAGYVGQPKPSVGGYFSRTA